MGALAVGLLLGLVMLEAALRWVRPPPTKFYVWPPATTARFQPSAEILPGVTGPSRFTTNSLGIRGGEFNQSGGQEYRILAIGGSTTECLYLDDTEAWPFLVQDILKRTAAGAEVWVGNAGKAGTNSQDHILHVRYLLPQYAGIHAVLVLAGINDLAVRLAQSTPPSRADATSEENVRRIMRAFSVVPDGLLPTLSTNHEQDTLPWHRSTAIYRALEQVRARVSAVRGSALWQDDEGRMLSSWRANRRAARRILDDLPDLASALAEYEANLNAIIDLARAGGSRVVLMTQPTLWRNDLEPEAERLLWMGGVGHFQEEKGGEYYSVRALAEAMTRYNLRLLHVCESRGIDCIDLAAQVPKTVEIFYDDAHFTERGARLVASIVSGHFATREPFLASEEQSR